jgi:hypothetical protein
MADILSEDDFEMELGAISNRINFRGNSSGNLPTFFQGPPSDIDSILESNQAGIRSSIELYKSYFDQS